MGVAMMKPHLLRPPHVVNNFHPVTWGLHANFSLVGSLLSFWQPKQFPMGVAITIPHPVTHPHVFNNAYPVTWIPHAKFWPGWCFN